MDPDPKMVPGPKTDLDPAKKGRIHGSGSGCTALFKIDSSICVMSCLFLSKEQGNVHSSNQYSYATANQNTNLVDDVNLFIKKW